MKHLITFALLLVAAGFYVAGMSTGVAIFAGAGVLAEGVTCLPIFGPAES